MSTVLRRQMLSDFKTVREGDILTPENRKFFDKIMTATVTGGDKLKAGLLQGTVFGHKTGSSSRTAEGIKIADNDAGFVICRTAGHIISR